MSSGFRDRLEHASAPVVRALARRRTTSFLLVLGLMAAGAFVPGVGFVATLLVAVFVGWLLVLTWPRLTGPEKLLRAAVLCLVLAVAAVQAFPRG